MALLELFHKIQILSIFILIISFFSTSAQSFQDTTVSSQYIKKAEILLTQKKLDSSIIYFKKGLTIDLKLLGDNHQKVIIYYDRIGLIYKNLGEHEIALDYFNTFLRLVIKKYGEYHYYAGYGFLNLGITYKNLLRYELALKNYKNALVVFNYCKKIDMTAFVYNSIGDIHAKRGDINFATEYYNKSIRIGTKLFGENYIENGKSFKNIGALYHSKRDHEKALSYYKKSLRILVNVYGKNSINTADIHYNIGELYEDKKEYDTSLTHYQKSLKAYMSILDNNDLKITKLNLRIANIYTKKEKNKDFKKAISFLDQAIIANKKTKYFDPNKNDFNPSEYYDLKLLLKTLHGKAKILQEKYIKDKNIESLDSSLKIYEQADILIDYIRKSHHNYQDKILFAKNSREVYLDAIKAQFLLYKIIKTKSVIEKIIYYIEKSKANALKDLINETKTKEFKGLSSELLSLEIKQKINRAFYQSRIIEERSNADRGLSKIKKYENKLLNVRKIEDSIVNIFKKSYPKYYQLKHQNTIILASKIQKMLKDKTSLVEFFTSGTITYVFVITTSKIEVKELKIPNLSEKIAKFKLSITNKHTKAYKSIGHQLYLDLIAPIQNYFTGEELIIIPDEVLWHLNFELLLNQKDSSNNPKELSYLLKEYIISYANSANLLFSNQEKSLFSFPPMQEKCLAFSFSADTDFQNSNTISFPALKEYKNDLPGTREEIKAIANIIDGNYFYGSEAVESKFKKNVSQYNILHLALHGEVDNQQPENSRLFFTKGKDKTEDDLLYSYELFALDIPAELTVLSACNTGVGKIAKGEGILSLGTAFQYAGTKSLLLSSWEVPDQTTPELMKYFYTNLKAGMSKSKALQQAKLQYLNSANINRTHPFYWGGFYLVGDASPIHFTDNTMLYWSIGLGVLGVFTLFFLGYRRRVKKHLSS